MAIRVYLETDRPALARDVATLTRAVDLASGFMDHEDGAVALAEDLLGALAAEAERHDDDHMDDLGPPRGGGTRITIETDRADHRQRILEAADLLRYLPGDAGERVTRLRVVMDLAPAVTRPAAHDDEECDEP